MKTKRIQRRRAKGWKNPENTIYVGRPTKFGNPFVIGVDGTQEECYNSFGLLCSGFICFSSKATIESQENYLQHLKDNLYKLKDKNLSCFCREGTKCHADILLKIIKQIC